MVRAIVPRKIPSEVVEKSNKAVANKSRGTEPAIGIFNTPSITKCSDSAVATNTTRPIAQIFEIIISAGVKGITNRCSKVPCSRSRMSAAPVRMTESMVIMLISSITLPNHSEVKDGLKRMRMATLMGKSSSVR